MLSSWDILGSCVIVYAEKLRVIVVCRHLVGVVARDADSTSPCSFRGMVYLKVHLVKRITAIWFKQNQNGIKYEDGMSRAYC